MSETLATNGNLRVRLVTDECGDNPRDEYDYVAHALTVPSHHYRDIDKDGGPLASAWRDLHNRYHWSNAVEIFQRWARIYHGATTLYDTPHIGANAVWYVLPDVFGPEPTADPIGLLKSERDEYRAWANGEVYGYVIERRVTWSATSDEYPDRDTWEHVDSVYGYIGYEYAESAARLAYAHFLASE